MIKKIISVITVICIFASVLTSCNKNEVNSDVNSENIQSGNTTVSDSTESTSDNKDFDISMTESVTSDQISSADNVVKNEIEKGYTRLADGKTLSFCIVKPETGTTEEMKACADFVSEMSKYYDNIQFYNDSNEAPEGANEIILGKTNRKQSVAYNAKIKNENDFSVGVADSQIVIAATGATGLKAGTEYFLKNFVKAKKNKIKSDFFYAYSQNVMKVTINGVDISKYKIVHPRAASYIYTSEITDLTKTILQLTGKSIKVVDEREKETDYEIVIGPTTRSVSKTLADKNTYSITVEGKKLIINAGGEDALSSAVYWLNQHIIAQKSKDLNLAKNFKQTGKYSYLNGKYKLVWNDEFDGDKLDTSKWTYKNEADGEFVRYTNDIANTYVSNGTLKQTCLKSVNGENNTYTVSHLDTSQAMDFIYGYCEIRVKLPTGKGVWPAFWGNYSKGNLRGFQEIDIFELFPGNDRRIAFNLHKWWYDVDPFSGAETQRNSNLDGAGLEKYVELKDGEKMGDAWHTIGIVWTDKSVVALFDGYPYFEQSITGESDDIFHTPIYLIINHIVVPKYVGTDKDTPFPNTMETDYIRLYQIPGVDKLYLK